MAIDVIIYVERIGKSTFNVALLYGNEESIFDGIEFLKWEEALDATRIFSKTQPLSHFNFLSKTSFYNLKYQEYANCDTSLDFIDRGATAISGAWQLTEENLYDFVEYVIDAVKRSDTAKSVKIEYDGQIRDLYTSGSKTAAPFYMTLMYMKLINIA